MKRLNWLVLLLVLPALVFVWQAGCAPEPEPEVTDPEENDPAIEEHVELPEPVVEEDGVSDALHERVSRRDYADESLELGTAGELLWAAGGVGVDGVTGATRTAPSAGGTYPVDLYLVAGAVEDLEPGVYRYDHEEHALELSVEGDRRSELATAALDQQFIAEAPLNVVMVAHYERTTATYGERGERYVHMDTGYASQNVYLMAEELGLGTVAIGAFDDEEVAGILATEGAPLMVMPVGEPQD